MHTIKKIGVIWGFIAALACSRASAQDLVYDDALESGWENWSWASVSLNNANPVHGGTAAIKVTSGAYQALYLHHAVLDGSAYTNLALWIHGGSAGGQRLQVQATSSGNAQAAVQIPALAANSWAPVTISLHSLGVDTDPAFDGFWIQDRSGTTQPAFFVDDIKLVAASGPPPVITNAPVQLTLDASIVRGPISDLIYGVAFASSNELKLLNVPLNRSGGNAESRYNWKINAHNRAADYFFESIGDASGTAAGAESDQFVRDTKAGGAKPMLTVPMLGWGAKLGNNRAKLGSFSIAKYGAQTDRDPFFSDAGNGIISQNPLQYVIGNDPNDANVPTDTLFQQQWVQHLTNVWGSAGGSGVGYYFLDNEPSIWFSTHRDVHPVGPTMRELRDKSIQYATMLKAVQPNALVLGPEEWGWSGYFYSGYDQQYGSKFGWNNLPDRGTNGGADYLPWFLDQMRKQSLAQGQRLLDVFTVHYYPQGGEFSDNTSSSMQLLRNRSTRSLWDPNYSDQSWISDKVRLIPRLKEWVNQNYPGTPIGITEYNWGAEKHINGATTQADLLGILGREGVDIATRWTTPDGSTPTFKAIQMYRNYDGAHSTFGESSIPLTTPNPDNLSAFAAQRTDGALTVMIVNKQLTGSTPLTLSINHFSNSMSAHVYQLTSANVISKLPDLAIAGGVISNSLPSQSISLFVIESAASQSLIELAVQNNTETNLTLSAHSAAGQRYVIESSADFSSWKALMTNSPGSSSETFVLPRTASYQFYRALVTP
ncbi:MAG: cellulase [Verrucomicrobiales bacterium]|nr:cellulase [Verrucomicrobiales bacterium]